jgi:hypothetical protein
MSYYTEEPALTYTLDQFIQMQYSDEMTYRNFSIVEVVNGIELLDHNLIRDYLDELNSLCINAELTMEQYKKYKYSPDLLAYDIYGSTQLDFVILFANDMIDPKEFDLKVVKLPYASKMKTFLSAIYNSESGYIGYNRSENGLSTSII